MVHFGFIQTGKKYWLLLGIAALATFLRIWQLGGLPVGLHGDEASIGYNAYSLLKTGRDQNGQFLPLTINQFGDYRPAGYHYIDIPFVAVFGLTALATRLPAAIFGIATVLLFYFLLCELFENRALAYLGSFFLAISPWHIIISRATSESVIAGFFVMWGTLQLFKATKDKKNSRRLLFTSLLLCSISFLFYHAARFFVPVFFIFLIPILITAYKPTKQIKRQLLVFFLVLCAAVAAILFIGKGANRPASVSIFNIPGSAMNELVQQIGEDGNQAPLITRFFHNKAFQYGRLFLAFYLQHFSGEFLFVTTGNPLRYKVPWSSTLNLIDLPLLLFGFSVLLAEGVKTKKYIYFIPLLWLTIGALPAGLTWEDIPNIQRASLMLPAYMTISAFGAFELYKLLTNRRLKLVCILIVAFVLFHDFTSFFHNYFHHLKTHEPWFRSANEENLVWALTALSKDYKEVVVTTENNNNLIFYLFYNKFDPAEFQRLGSPQEHDNLKFQNLVFRSMLCPLQKDTHGLADGDPETLYVNSDKCELPINVEVVETIRRPDGHIAFYILKILPVPSVQ